jgi:hypothetical protein
MHDANCLTLRASRDEFVPFDSQLSCFRSTMQDRAHLNRMPPGVRIRAVPLNRWILRLD